MTAKKEEIEVEEIEVEEVTQTSGPIDIKVVVNPTTWAEIMFMVKQVDTEISFMADVHKVGENVYVHNWYLPKQVNTGSSTDMDAEDLGTIPIPTKGHTNCWIHSHVDMKAFWSGTDWATIKQLGRFGWILSIVVNKKGEYKCCYYQTGDKFFPPMFLDNIPITVSDILSDERKKAITSLVEEKCSAPVYIKEDSWWKNRPSTPRYIDTREENQKLLDTAVDWDYKPIPKKLLKRLVNRYAQYNLEYDEEDIKDSWEDYQFLHHDVPTEHQFIFYLESGMNPDDVEFLNGGKVQ